MIGTILYQDNHLLVIDKPAGIPTQGSRPGERSLLAVAKEYLKQKYGKPGNVFLAAVSRLDERVSGVVVLARTSKAAARLNAQFAGREVAKTYWAIVHGKAIPDSGRLVDRLVADETARRMRIVDPNTPGEFQGKLAELEFHVLARRAPQALLVIGLRTGRKHQIRVQLADRGWPILGDRKYDSRHPFAPGSIALHAWELRLQHPTLRTELVFRTPPPASWNLSAFGSDYATLAESLGNT